jgi:hypothetical protein
MTIDKPSEHSMNEYRDFLDPLKQINAMAGDILHPLSSGSDTMRVNQAKQILGDNLTMLIQVVKGEADLTASKLQREDIREMMGSLFHFKQYFIDRLGQTIYDRAQQTLGDLAHCREFLT